MKAFGSIRFLFVEFMKYSVVGGVAFAADFATLVCAQECFFRRFENGVYFAVMLGFVVGLAVNYAMSLRFVFTRENYAGRGRSVGAFVVFGIVGALGLALTELGMWVGIEVLLLNYMLVKILVTAMVLVWNYVGRKLLVFGAKGAP